VLSARPPRDFGSGIRRLFPDYEAIEADYFRETGIFPIMHVIVIKTEVLERHPWLAMNFYKAFEEAKRRSLARLSDITASHAPLAWLATYTERMKGLSARTSGPTGWRRTAPRFRPSSILRSNKVCATGASSSRSCFPSRC